jgi:hypothetical protein
VALWPWQPSKWQQQNSVHVTGDCRQSQMSETGITPASARNVAAQFLSPYRLVRRSLSQSLVSSAQVPIAARPIQLLARWRSRSKRPHRRSESQASRHRRLVAPRISTIVPLSNGRNQRGLSAHPLRCGLRAYPNTVGTMRLYNQSPRRGVCIGAMKLTAPFPV